MNGKMKISLAVLALTLALSLRADDVTDKGRDIFKKYQKGVVTVQVVQKMTFSSGGRTSEPRESKMDVTGTVMEANGLTVVSLTSCDPTEMYRRVYGDQFKAESEISDIKILLDDGTELPAEIVLRDKDLDLAFIRPKTKPTTAMLAVDFSKSSPAQVLDTVITLNRLGRAAGRAYSASLERITAVVQKPRTFYVPDSTMSSTALGSPAFALDGNVVGIVVIRSISGGASSSAARQDNATSILLPAEDVLKAAKQAPEAKGESSDKKEEPKKDAAKESKPEPKKE